MLTFVVLVLVLLLRTAAVPAVHIFSVIVITSNILIVLMGAAINRTDIRWQLYYIAAVARLAMGTGTISLGCYYAMKINHPWLTSTFILCASISCLIWAFSPFAWYLCEGHHALSVDEEMVMYSALDIIAKPIVCSLLLQMHRAIDPSIIGMTTYKYDGWSSVAISTPVEED